VTAARARAQLIDVVLDLPRLFVTEPIGHPTDVSPAVFRALESKDAQLRLRQHMDDPAQREPVWLAAAAQTPSARDGACSLQDDRLTFRLALLLAPVWGRSTAEVQRCAPGRAPPPPRPPGQQKKRPKRAAGEQRIDTAKRVFEQSAVFHVVRHSLKLSTEVGTAGPGWPLI
jgi:hypothetical protein